MTFLSSLIYDLEKVKQNFRGRNKVLDIGAGAGNTKSLFDKDWEWFGIDIVPQSEAVDYGDAHEIDFPVSCFYLAYIPHFSLG